MLLKHNKKVKKNFGAHPKHSMTKHIKTKRIKSKHIVSYPTTKHNKHKIKNISIYKIF